jgi:hypothetical protein
MSYKIKPIKSSPYEKQDRLFLEKSAKQEEKEQRELKEQVKKEM